MSILSGKEILKQMDYGKIIINPFKLDNLNPNSYNLTLSDTLIRPLVLSSQIDSKTPELIRWTTIKIPSSGYKIDPCIGYLGSTVEYTESNGFVPVIDGRSSMGRLFTLVHCSAGFGDNGFKGHWTLEIVALSNPIIIYPNQPIAQIRFHTIEGEKDVYKGRYQNQSEPTLSKGV